MGAPPNGAELHESVLTLPRVPPRPLRPDLLRTRPAPDLGLTPLTASCAPARRLLGTAREGQQTHLNRVPLDLVTHHFDKHQLSTYVGNTVSLSGDHS